MILLDEAEVVEVEVEAPPPPPPPPPVPSEVGGLLVLLDEDPQEV